MADYTGTGLPPDFWSKVSGALSFSQQTKAPSELEIAINVIRNMDKSRINDKRSDLSSGGTNLGGKSLSALGWVIDKVSRPLYGMENTVMHGVKDWKKEGASSIPDTILKSTMPLYSSDFWKGFTGKEKVSGAAIAKEAGIKNKFAKGALGLLFDVGLDPLTYVPGGTIARAASTGLRAAKLEKAASTVEKGQKAIEKVQHVVIGKPIGAAIKGARKAIESSPAGEARKARALEAGPTGRKLMNEARLAKLTPKPGAMIGKVGEQLNMFPTPRFSASAGGVVSEIGRQLETPPVGEAAIPTGKEMGMRPMIAQTGRPLFGPAAQPVKPLFTVRADGKNILTKQGMREAAKLQKAAAEKGKTLSLQKAGQKLFNEQKAAPILQRVETAEKLAASRPPEEILRDATHGDSAARSVIENTKTPGLSSRGGMATTDGSKVAIRTLDELTPHDRGLVEWAIAKHTIPGETLHPKAQADLFKDISNAIHDPSKAMELSRVAMGEVAKAGRSPEDWSRNPFNLLDTVDELGGTSNFKNLGVKSLHDLSTKANRIMRVDSGLASPTTIRTIHPDIVRAVERQTNVGKAAKASEMAATIKPHTDAASTLARQIAARGGSDIEIANALEKTAEATRSAMTKAGDDPIAIKTAVDQIRDMKYPDTPAGKLANDTGHAQLQASASGKANAVADKKAREVAREGQTPKESLDEQVLDSDSAVTQRNIWQTIAAWFNPAMGMKQVRQDMLAGKNFRQQEYAKFSTVVQNIIKDTTESQRKAAWNEVRNGTANSPLAKDMQKLIHNTVSSLDATDEALAGQSILLRAGLSKDALNRELLKKGWDTKKWHFTDKYMNHLGETVDLSNGADWVKSIFGAAVGDPMELITRVRDAVESELTMKTVLGDISDKFGKEIAQGAHRVKSSHVDNMHFEPHIAKQIDVMMKNLEELRDPTSQLWRTMSQGMRVYKTWFTLPNPNHHINNNIGNMWFNWMAGVNNPKHYRRANKVMSYVKEEYKSITGLQSLGENALNKAMTAPVDPSSIILTTKGGHKITVSQFHLLAKKHGILVNAHVAEDIPGAVAKQNKLVGKLTDNPIINAGKKISEMSENWSRYAHFSHELENSRGPLNEAASKAAARVRKFHPDGTDLTPFEQKYMRNIIPFYSWQRKAIPLAMETMVTSPGKVVAIPKASLALANMMGIEGGTLSDPFPKNEAFPAWIRENVWGPQIPFGSGGFGIFAPQIPTFEVARTFDPTHPVGSLKNIGASLNPLARVPIEVARGRHENGLAKDLFTDKVYRDASEYASQQIPVLSQVQRITGRDPLGGFAPTRGAQYRADQGGSVMNWPGALNWLTGSGFHDLRGYSGQ